MFDLYGIGNAIVDTDVEVDDGFLADADAAKGQMTLVDSAKMSNLVDKLKHLPMNRASGGSAANTIFAAQAFGLSTAYTCRLADDENGRHFDQEMRAAGIQISALSEPAQNGRRSGQCLVMVTPDGQRTMCTDLGVSSELEPSQVDAGLLKTAQVLYIEGYLASSEHSVATAVNGYQIAQSADKKIALTLSDVSMVSFFRDGLTAILGNGIDTLFCNAEEALAWANTDRLDVAIAELSDIAKEIYVTMGAQGARVVSDSGTKDVAGDPHQPLDTNGAGDMFSGACLAARLQGALPEDAARFANHAAAKVIMQFGARLPTLADYHALKDRFMSS